MILEERERKKRYLEREKKKIHEERERSDTHLTHKHGIGNKGETFQPASRKVGLKENVDFPNNRVSSFGNLQVAGSVLERMQLFHLFFPSLKKEKIQKFKN